MFRNFSPNMLKTFELCPKKFCFRYVKNISMPVNECIFETGKNIHALASYYLKKEDISRLETALDDKERLMWEYLKGLRYFSYACIGTEYNLSVKIGANFFSGRLDALVKDGEKYCILDYKTGGAPKNAKFDYQTMIYLLSVSAFYNTYNVLFVYLDLKHRKETVIELTENLSEEYKERLIKTADLINREAYASQHNQCPCEYDILCY